MNLNNYRPLIEAALKRSEEGGSFTDVQAEVDAQRAHLWGGRKSCAITQFHEHRALHVWLAAGEREELKFMAESAAQFAKSIGANVMTADNARPGWARILKDMGFREIRMLVKDLG